LLVNKKVAIVGGVEIAMFSISSSEITPGPLGISETNPITDAPLAIAICASSID